MRSIDINSLVTYTLLLLFVGMLFGCKPIFEEKPLPPKDGAAAPALDAPPAELVTSLEEVKSIESLGSGSVAAPAPVVDDGNDVVTVTPAIMRKVQQALVNAGLNPGPVDGVSGAKTEAAIKSFQAQNGIPAGKLTKRTLRALGTEESHAAIPDLRESAFRRSPASSTISSNSIKESEKAPDDPFAAIDQALKKLLLGNIAFNVPHEINIDETHIIQLVLGLEAPIDELKQMIKAEDNKEDATVRVSTTMEARLSGSNFSVTATTPEVQRISRTEVTKWAWEIKPLKEGAQYLHLTLSALIDIDGKTAQRAIQTFDKKIEIRVTLNQLVASFLKNNWQWLWAVILAPVFGWLWRNKKES